MAACEEGLSMLRAMATCTCENPRSPIYHLQPASHETFHLYPCNHHSQSVRLFLLLLTEVHSCYRALRKVRRFCRQNCGPTTLSEHSADEASFRDRRPFKRKDSLLDPTGTLHVSF